MLASAPTTPKTMAATNNILKIGLAQIDGRLGDVEHNAELHLEWIARAREAGVDLLVFPELRQADLQDVVVGGHGFWGRRGGC